MAAQVGVSRMSVNRVWREHALKPHQVKSFKVSNDPLFAEKLRDVIGLYLNPPEKAGTMTHDYKRHGTTTLFAALNVHEGTVIGECLPRHRNDEFLKFLKKLDAQTDKALDVHLIVDNYATHKHPNVKDWLAKHPRFSLHFTPTSASWVNMVERFFRGITEEQIHRGVFRSVAELKEAINQYLEHRNANPKPYHWTATPEQILRKANKTKDMLWTLR